MEDQLWKGILRLLKQIHKPRRRAGEIQRRGHRACLDVGCAA